MMSDRDRFWAFVFLITLATALAVLALVLGLPLLWDLVKPFLHTLTA